MKRAATAYLLCLLHLAFVVMPEVQLWQYIVFLSHQQISNETVYKRDSSSPLTGDIAYLNALVKRGKETQESNKQENTVPETVVSHTGLIYLVVEAFNNEPMHCKKLNWAIIYNRKPLDGILKILAPPPKSVFV